MRERRAWVGIIVSLAALPLAASVAAMSEAITVPSRVTISYNPDTQIFSGKVSSRNSRCVARRRVELKLVLPGPDKRVAATRTNAQGNWVAFSVAGDDVDATTGQTQEYRGEVVRNIQQSKNRPLLRCGPATSRTIEVVGPFSLGPSPVVAEGTFTNGRGGCPFSTSFSELFDFLAPGDGTLTISQPRTGDRVSGQIQPDGSFQLRSAGESYEGKITGNTVNATYTYTANGCTESYDVTFVLRR